jgi:hypothetical protein
MAPFPSRRFAAGACAAFLFLLSGQNALAADTVKPSVGQVSPKTATVGVEVTFTASYSDNDSGVVLCKLLVDFEDLGAMQLSGSVASMPHTFTAAGEHVVYVYCRDEAGNAATGPHASVTVSAGSSSGDTTAPAVGTVTPTSAHVGVAVTFQAPYFDAGGVTGCRLIVNGFDQGSMTLANGVASRSHTFDAAGSFPVFAQCFDTAGNAGAGTPVSVDVETAPVPPIPPELPPTVTPGLVKLACPAGSDASHPCRSVYYRATDGTRHAFPNEKTYFTWYADFSGVVEIGASAMAALPLGHNVTYRPGVRMVKFVTDPKTYAVAKKGVLRWVASESLAASLYGSAWNTKIDDLSDAFAADYSFGPEIMSVSDFSPAAATAATPTIDSNF